MTYRVRITDITHQFHKAHDALIESLGGSEHIYRTSIIPINQMIAQNWQSKYGIKLVMGDISDGWKWLEFRDEKHFTHFLIKWS